MLDKLLKYSNNNSLYINKIIPNAKPCIGLYTNEIKAIAKEMVKEEKYSFFQEKHEVFEEDMIHGFMIGYIKDWDYAFEEFKKYINLNHDIIYITYAGISVEEQERLLSEINNFKGFKQIIVQKCSATNACFSGRGTIGMAVYVEK